MIWADRVAIVLVLMVTSLYAVLWPIPPGAPISPGQLYTIVCLVPWLLMRALDFVATGRMRPWEQRL